MSFVMQSKIINRKSKINPGFTLIELLVVIAIIGVLMGLLFPALSAARQRARITRAKMEMNQLETAWVSYRNDYRHLPLPNAYGGGGANVPGTMNVNAVNILRGLEVQVGGQNYNTRKIVYMDFPEGTTTFNDPWGEPYKIRMAIQHPNPNVQSPNPNQVSINVEGSVQTLNRPVALYSIGSGQPITSW